MKQPEQMQGAATRTDKPDPGESGMQRRVAILLLALVLYVLSIGPVGYVAIRTDTSGASFLGFYAPLAWLMESGNPLGVALKRYVIWWGERGFVDRNRGKTTSPPP